MPPPKPSKLDFEQVLPAAFDDATGSLRTNATLVASGETQIIVTNTDDSIAIGTPAGLFTGTVSGGAFALDVNVVNSQSTIINQATSSIKIGDGVNLITSTTVGPDVGLDVNVIAGSITGEIKLTGLKTGLDTQAVFVSDIATKVPATPLPNRNGMSVRVVTSGITVFFGNSTVTVADGYPKFFGEEIIIDIRSNPAVDLWAICNTGTTGELRIMEVA